MTVVRVSPQRVIKCSISKLNCTSFSLHMAKLYFSITNLTFSDCVVEYAFNLRTKGYIRNYLGKKKLRTAREVLKAWYFLLIPFTVKFAVNFLCPGTIFLNSFSLVWLSNIVRLMNLLAQLLLKDIFYCKTSDPGGHRDKEFYDPW